MLPNSMFKTEEVSCSSGQKLFFHALESWKLIQNFTRFSSGT